MYTLFQFAFKKRKVNIGPQSDQSKLRIAGALRQLLDLAPIPFGVLSIARHQLNIAAGVKSSAEDRRRIQVKSFSG